MVKVFFDGFVFPGSTVNYRLLSDAILFCDFDKLQKKVSHGKKKCFVQ